MNENLNITSPHNNILYAAPGVELLIGYFYDEKPIYRIYIEGYTPDKINEGINLNNSIPNFVKPLTSNCYVYCADIYRPVHYSMLTSNIQHLVEYGIKKNGSVYIRVNSNNWISLPVIVTMDFLKTQ